MKIPDRSRLEALLRDEEKKFHNEHPKSYELFLRARKSMQGGVPMLWMIRWAGSLQEDVDYHTKVFREAVVSLFGNR